MPSKRTYPNKQLQRRFLDIGKAVLLVGILVLVGLFSAYLGIRIAVRGNEVQVPSLLKAQVESARQQLKKRRLDLDVIGQRYDPEVPKGAVIVQDPGPGGTITARRSVQVIVSLGKSVNPIPDLIGSTMREARLLVTQAGYELGNVSTVSLPGREDQIIQQYPAALSKEISNPKIDILLSMPSSRHYIMPDFLGQNLNRVMAAFNTSGIKLGKIEYRRVPGTVRGAVVKQFPEPGYMLSEDASVNLEVAR